MSKKSSTFAANFKDNEMLSMRNKIWFAIFLLFTLLSSFFTSPLLAQEVQRTNLPTVYITTRDGAEPYDKEHELRCRVTIIDGAERLTDSASVRLRGNASKDFPKKPYHLRFDTKHSVLGSPATAKRWTLINNYGDKTLMRNLLAFDLSRRLEMPYTPFGRAVDVVFNGDYKGCYQLCDQVHVHANRVEVDEGGFFFEADAYATDEKVYFWSDNGTPVSVHYPDDEVITDAQREAVRRIFNTLEQSSHPNLDRETFLRHFLVGEISGNTDTYWSTYFYKRSTSDTVFTGPVWDFDIAFENDYRTYPICQLGDYVYRANGSCAGDMRHFVNNVIRNSDDRRRLEAIYADYRDRGVLTEDALIAVIDSLEQEIQASAALNFQRWPILNHQVHMNPRAGGTYAREVQWVRDYIRQRIPWMDSKLNYQPAQSIDNTPFLSGEGRGEACKILRNGQLLILRGDRTYTVTGLELK